MTQGLRPKGMNSYDSIQSSQNESDLFHTIRNHQTPHANPARNLGRPESKDVLVSLQDKLELEAQEKFRRGDYRFASDKLLIIGRIGKYMFLAVMLPTYLCLYGLPRWMLVEAIPKTLNMANEFAKQAAKIVTEISDWIKAQALLIMELLKIQKGDSEAKTGEDLGYKKQFRAFWKSVLFIPRGLIRAAEVLSQPIHKVSNYLKSSWFSFIKAIRDFLLRVEARINQSFKAVIKALLKPLFFVLMKLKENVIKPQVEKLKAIFIRTFERYKKKVVESAETLKNFSKQSLSILRKAFDAVKKITISTLSSIPKTVTPLILWCRVLIKRPKEGFKQAYQAIASSFKRLQSYTSGLLEIINRFFTKQLERLKKGFERVPGLIDQYTPLWVKRLIRQSKRFAKYIADTAVKTLEWTKSNIIAPLKKQLASLYALFKQFLRYLIDLLKKGLDLLIAGIKASPQKTYELLVKIVDLSKRAFNFSTYGIRVLLAWSKVLWNHGMHLVREVAIEISEHIKIFSIRR